MHSVPDYEHLLAVVEDVDAIEVFNPRIAIPAYNEEAVRFAAKYRIVGGAGSDSHVAQGLGSVRIRMRDFDGPEEFLDSLADADIVGRPCSLYYAQVQALKFLQTRATPPSARAGGAQAPDPPGDLGAQSLMQGKGEPPRHGQTPHRDAGHRRRDPREVPGARDPRAQPLHARPPGVHGVPAREPDAGPRLGPPAGGRSSCSSTRRCPPRSRRAWPSTAAPEPR